MPFTASMQRRWPVFLVEALTNLVQNEGFCVSVGLRGVRNVVNYIFIDDDEEISMIHCKCAK